METRIQESKYHPFSDSNPMETRIQEATEVSGCHYLDGFDSMQHHGARHLLQTTVTSVSFNVLTGNKEPGTEVMGTDIWGYFFCQILCCSCRFSFAFLIWDRPTFTTVAAWLFTMSEARIVVLYRESKIRHSIANIRYKYFATLAITSANHVLTKTNWI
jgi:hypothetical protein